MTPKWISGTGVLIIQLGNAAHKKIIRTSLKGFFVQGIPTDGPLKGLTCHRAWMFWSVRGAWMIPCWYMV